MEGDRKYRQNGYNDSGFNSRESNHEGSHREDRPRPQGPKPPIDVTGPRLPRMVQAVTASRCYNCATMLPSGSEFPTECHKCHAALHCCKQCSYFEPSTRFQCLKPIPVRIAGKDQANQCELFKPRVTVARDSVQPPAYSGYGSNGHSNGNGNGNGQPARMNEPRNPSDARAAFDNLFRKSD